jgi:hypothetical protein
MSHMIRLMRSVSPEQAGGTVVATADLLYSVWARQNSSLIERWPGETDGRRSIYGRCIGDLNSCEPP